MGKNHNKNMEMCWT